MPQNPGPIRPWNLCYCCLVAKLCPALMWPIDCSPPGSSIHGTSQARNWSGLPFPSPGELPNLGIKSTPLVPPPLAGGFFTTEPPMKPLEFILARKEKTREMSWNIWRISFSRTEIWGKKKDGLVYIIGYVPLPPQEWEKEDPHGCGKSEATADQSTQVLRESLKMVSSKEVRSSGMGSTCEMSAEMGLILIPCLLLNYLGSVGAQVFLLAVGVPGWGSALVQGTRMSGIWRKFFIFLDVSKN